MAHYDAVIVRVWRSKSPAGWQWSGQLERIPGGEILHFTDPTLLLTYLQQAFCHDGTPQDLAAQLPAVTGREDRDPSEA